MTRCIVFDSGPIITLTMNNLLWILDPLKERFAGEFYITKAVKMELIDKPLSTNRFKFQSLQILQYVGKDVIRVVHTKELEEKTEHLLNLANRCFKAHGHCIEIVHKGEIESLAAALLLGAEAIVIDERTTRYLIEKPQMLAERLEGKLHTDVSVDQEMLMKWKHEMGHLKVIRSMELAVVAYEMGLLDLFLTKKEEQMIPDIRKVLLEAVLWGVKMHGCAIAEEEIDDVIKHETLTIPKA